MHTLQSFSVLSQLPMLSFQVSVSANYKGYKFKTTTTTTQSQWPGGLTCRPAASRLLGLRVRITPAARMSVSGECCVLSSREALCSKKVYRVWCAWVLSWSLDNEEAFGLRAVAPWWEKIFRQLCSRLTQIPVVQHCTSSLTCSVSATKLYTLTFPSTNCWILKLMYSHIHFWVQERLNCGSRNDYTRLGRHCFSVPCFYCSCCR